VGSEELVFDNAEAMGNWLEERKGVNRGDKSYCMAAKDRNIQYATNPPAVTKGPEARANCGAKKPKIGRKLPAKADIVVRGSACSTMRAPAGGTMCGRETMPYPGQSINGFS
jgi:hypothetical protein